GRALTRRRRNCVSLPGAAAAEAAGFRPCLRCRPEASPGTPAWLGTSATVSRALRLIDAGALDGGGVPALAARLGIGERPPRRLFLPPPRAAPPPGAPTPPAARFLGETRPPIAQGALAAGFASVRRFNEAMRGAFHTTPSALRRRRGRAAAAPAPDLVLRLAYRPPLPWATLLGFFAARAIPGVGEVAAGAPSPPPPVGPPP